MFLCVRRGADKTWCRGHFVDDVDLAAWQDAVCDATKVSFLKRFQTHVENYRFRRSLRDRSFGSGDGDR